MRITHIFASDLKSVSEGGIATYVRELIKRQSENGIHVSLVGVTGDLQDNIGEWRIRKIGSNSFSFLPLFYTPNPHLTYRRGIPLNARFLWHLWINRRKILIKDSILHIHRVELAVPFLFSKNKVSIVLTIHGLGKAIEHAATHVLYNKRWFRFLYYKMEFIIVRKADKIILVSQEGLDHYTRKFFKDRNKFIFIPTFIDTDLFKILDKQRLRTTYGFRTEEKIILFVGRFDYLKGIDLLIDAFEKVKEHISETRLLLVGEGKEREYLQRKAKEMRITGVDFPGMIEHDKIPQIMNCADVFVLTSLWEGLPLVALEALACGLPVVSTNVGQLSEIVKDGITGYLINKREREEVERKIILALRSADDMKEKCREIAQKYSSAFISSEIAKVYREVAGKDINNAIRKNSEPFNSEYYEAYESISQLRKKGDKPYLYAYWARYLRKLKPKGRLLDVGCGLGLFLKRMQDTYETYGIDISGYAVEEAKKIAVSSEIKIGSAVEISYEDNFFDIVAAFDIVEHLEDPGLFLNRIQRVLKKDGVLVISTPNPESFGARVKANNEWAGTRDATHINLLPCVQWRSLIEQNGFTIIRDGTDFLWDVPYFEYIPYRLQWLLFLGLTWVLVWINGFYSWKFGENYICVAKKP